MTELANFGSLQAIACRSGMPVEDGYQADKAKKQTTEGCYASKSESGIHNQRILPATGHISINLL
jgi:hypothetical protein